MIHLDETLTRELAALVTRRASRLRWHPVAPERDETMREIWTPAASFPVWTGASDSSIYGDAAANWRFRAWHDSCHLASGRGFDLASELYVSLKQSADVARESAYIADVIWADNAGQQFHFYKHGFFPVNQRAFVAAFLKNRCKLPAEPF